MDFLKWLEQNQTPAFFWMTLTSSEWINLFMVLEVTIKHKETVEQLDGFTLIQRSQVLMSSDILDLASTAKATEVS